MKWEIQNGSDAPHFNCYRHNSNTTGIVFIVLGFNFPFTGLEWGTVFLGAVIIIAGIALMLLNRELVSLIEYLWAIKYRRIGAILATVSIIVVIVTVNIVAHNKATLNILHYDGDTWTEVSHYTSITPIDIWGSSTSDIFVVGDID